MAGQKILVIGGGISGLAVAIELARAEKKVILLEARERLGGRIFTIHSNEMPIELGAEFIHGGSEELWREIRAAKLETIRVPNHFRLFENCSFRAMNLWKMVGQISRRIDKNLPDEPFQNFLRKQELPRETKKLLKNFVEGFDAADTAKIGIHGMAGGNSTDNPGANQFRIVQGYSALIDFLTEKARRLGVEIKMQTVVRSVFWKKENVEVGATSGNRKVVFRGRAAVVTLPLGVLKSGAIEFNPPIGKREPIEKLEFGNVLKIVLQFRRAFWPERNFGFVTAVNEIIPTWWSDNRGNILTGWAGGPKADALAKRSKQFLADESLKILAKILGTKANSIQKELIEFHVHDWRNDPFSRGAYSYVPVNGFCLPKILAAPVGDVLFFAGEATADGDEPGTVHGAFDSGLRAAKEILQIIKRR